MQILLGYSKWENFIKVIDKAKEACEHASEHVLDHFPDVRKTIAMPKGAEKAIDDMMLYPLCLLSDLHKMVIAVKNRSLLRRIILRCKPGKRN